MADRILEAPEAHSLAEWVAVHNFFIDPLHREEVAGSAILGLRRLEVLMGALKVAQAGWSDHEDPVVLAWLESLGDDVEFSSERGGMERWTVSRRALDALHRAHRDDPAAEEILWKSARYPYVPGGCRRSLRCLFDIPLRGVSRYWLAYPDGAFVGEAVRGALGRIDDLAGGIVGGSVLEFCEEVRADPDSWRADAWHDLGWETDGISGARELRATLTEVGEEDRAPLLDYLDDLEGCANEVAARRPSEVPVPVAEAPADRPDTIVAGEAWVSGGRDCWIPRSQTAPAGTGEHVLAIADRFLTSGEGRTRDHALCVYNVLASRHRGHRALVDASALLTLRRLQVLREVLKTISPTFSATDALARGWATQLDDEVRLWSIGAQWLVRDDAFLRAYEAHRGSPAAEDILWEFATGPTPHDCVYDFACTARVEVADKLVRYWTDYPRGRHVATAARMVTERLGGFMEICAAARDAAPGAREADRWESVYWDPKGAETARELRATLAEVAQGDKAPLIELLDDLDECAATIGGTR